MIIINNIKVNRRIAKTLHKKYRLYKRDIWGRIAGKRKYNFITRTIYNANSATFSSKARYTRIVQYYLRMKNWQEDKKYKRKITVKKQDERRTLRALRKRKLLLRRLLRGRWLVQSINNDTKFFTYKLTNQSKYQRRKPLSYRGRILRYRRLISLFYGGGRIRKKTFRRYGRMLRADHKRREDIGTVGYSSFFSVIESRIDVLLFRANFVDTIYQARQLVFNRGVKVRGYKVINNPGFLVKIWVPFSLRDDLWRKLRMTLYSRILEKRVIGFPEYLYINFAVMLAFKMREPRASKLKYPFSTIGYESSAVFRHAFRVL